MRQMLIPTLWLVSMSIVMSADAQTFEAFRFRSGMSPEQVVHVVAGYELRWTRDKEVAFLVNGQDIYANLGFCDDKLVSVIRKVDADTEFLTYLQDGLRDYGQPKVTVRKDAWTGSGSGEITYVDFSWTRLGVGHTVSLAPEGRTGSGELRYIRSASVHVFVEHSSCFGK
jgi:hypothetical protein